MTAARLPPAGLYAVTPDGADSLDRLLRLSRAALDGGARLLQYRSKRAPTDRRRREATALRALCREHGAPFIVNDYLDLALAVAADGVHLGRDDTSLAAARAELGPDAIIGVSCYDDAARAVAMAEQGADYIALGSFFPTTSKAGATACGIETLRAVRAAVDVPICAIGGITAANGGILVANGANFLAVISGVFAADDPAAAASACAALFE